MRCLSTAIIRGNSGILDRKVYSNRMRLDTETNRIYVRQSWLKDMMLCPERSRYSVTSPKFRVTSDSAAIGTAVHAGIETILTTEVSVAEATKNALSKFAELRTIGIKETNVTPSEYENHIIRLVKAFSTDILPSVMLGGQAELQFAVNTHALVGPYELWFEGTMDYVSSDGAWDWKTSARKYSENEKQTQDIQSTIYNYAATELGLIEPDTTFRFGVMIRNASASGQIVHIHRNASHSSFVITQAQSAVNYVLNMTNNNESYKEKWLINDQHFLCSERWCPWWSLCKGAHISG